LSKAITTDAGSLTISDLGGSQSAKSVLSNKRGLSGSLLEVLGAVGIGIVLLAGAGVGIAYGINTSQDGAAKSVLDSVKAAQVSFQTANGKFGEVDDLTTGDTPPLTSKPDHFAINATDTNYCAVIRSGSMGHPTYWITAKSGKVLTTAPTNNGDADCPAAP
jgi:hypothetical protein